MPCLPLPYRFILTVDDTFNRNRALTASIVGGVCFFIALVLGSICLVKSHSKQKRKKIEKCIYAL